MQFEALFSGERANSYLNQCMGDFGAAVSLYRWNSAVAAAFWEPIGHLEVALRNALSVQLAERHRRLGRETQSWLDDPDRELSGRAREVIAVARARVRSKGKRESDGQTISELGFGFWRFLLAKRATILWPDLAGAFPDAPGRRRETVEGPLARVHAFRNRVAHHQRVWNSNPRDVYADLLCLAGYIDPTLASWIEGTSSVPGLLLDCGRKGRWVRLDSN